MKTAGRVSAIVPFLNEELFLIEAVESVLAQSYENWELLLVDDGSSDGSTQIAVEYAARAPDRITYLAHADGRTHGLAGSRNLGIEHATGDFIAFLDADDVWLSHKLEEQTTILASEPSAGMVYGLSQWWYSWTGRGEDMNLDYIHELGLPEGSFDPPSLIEPFFALQTAAIPNPSSILVRHALVDELDGFETAVRDIYEDQAFYAKVCLRAPVVASRAVWDRYRQHPDSITARVRNQGEEGMARACFLSWLIGYLAEQGLADAKLLATLRRQRFSYMHPLLSRLAQAIGRGN